MRPYLTKMPRISIVTLSISTLISWTLLAYMMYNKITHSNQVWPIIPKFTNRILSVVPGYTIMSCYTIMHLLAPFQFLPIPKWFRTIYLLIVMSAAASGLFYMNFNDTTGGSMMTVPFTVYSTLLFIYAAIAINRHFLWMIRVYILSLAGVIYQLLYLIPFLTQEQFTFNTPLDQAFNWLCFVIPLCIGEIALFFYYHQPLFYCRLRSRDYITISDSEEQFVGPGIVVRLPKDGRLINPNYTLTV